MRLGCNGVAKPAIRARTMPSPTPTPQEDRTRTNDREQATGHGGASDEGEDDDPQHAASALPLARAGESLERIGRHGGLCWALGRGCGVASRQVSVHGVLGSRNGAAAASSSLHRHLERTVWSFRAMPQGSGLACWGLIGTAPIHGQPCRRPFTARQNSK